MTQCTERRRNLTPLIRIFDMEKSEMGATTIGWLAGWLVGRLIGMPKDCVRCMRELGMCGSRD